MSARAMAMLPSRMPVGDVPSHADGDDQQPTGSYEDLRRAAKP
jgi:hypothetical protein